MKQSSIQQLLYNAQEVLTTTSDTSMLDAEILLAHVLNKPRSYLHTHIHEPVLVDDIHLFADYLQRRANGEPIAYIIGMWEFWSLPLAVTPDVLIPRPETELLIETILSLFPDSDQSLSVADLGTGSGAIALALASERPAWRIVATDISEKALQIASENAHQLSLSQISFSLGSWCTPLPEKYFDVIVSNPPYIAEVEWEQYASGLQFEPRTALVAGRDGLNDIREICHSVISRLRAGGYLLIEHGFMQGMSVREIFVSVGLTNVHTLRDIAGNERITVGHYLAS